MIEDPLLKKHKTYQITGKKKQVYYVCYNTVGWEVFKMMFCN